MTMASGVYGPTIRDVWDGTQLAVDFDNDAFNMALVTDTHTPDFNADSVWADVDNEVSGTGYTSGGNSMSGKTWTTAGGSATFDATDTQWTSATISNIRGRIVVDDTLTGDQLILATTFGQDYSVTSGTLTVEEDANGLWVLDYTP